VKPGSPAPSGGQSPGSIHLELNKILASEGFVNSERLSRFLRFTVEETLQGRGEQLKEYFLGVEVFDRDPSYDPRTDPIVRVEAGRLRGKLATYYEKEGCDDPLVIEFKKGSYVPCFQRRESPPGEARARVLLGSVIRTKRLALASAILAAAVAGYWIVALRSQVSQLRGELAAVKRELPDQEFGPIWGAFFAPGAENVVVFGSPMFFTSDRYRIFLRTPTVNDPSSVRSNPEFQSLQERFGDLLGPRYDYASMGDAIGLQQLTAFFARGGRALKAVPAHRAVWDSIATANVIFLGAPRMNPLLQRLPFKQDFQVGPPDTYIYNLNPQPGEEKIYTTPSHREALTYAVIASFPGLRPNREVMVVTAHQTSGLRGAVEYVTELGTARVMIEKLKLSASGPRKYYQLLLRVHADQDDPVKTEYVTHHVVPSPASER